MMQPLTLSDTIFTSPIQSPNSKQIRKQKLLFPDATISKKGSREKKKPDYESALQFADFIGLSPVNKIKRKHLSNVEKFFQTNNFKQELIETQNKSFSSKFMIKNDLQNRKINFFDLKRIFQHRTHSLKLQKSKQHFKQKAFILQTQVKFKQSRIMSARSAREPFLRAENQNHFQDEDDPDSERLRIQTARQINRNEKERSMQNQEAVRYMSKIQSQKSNRLKILKDISKDAIQNPQFNHQSIKFPISPQKSVPENQSPYEKINTQKKNNKEKSTQGLEKQKACISSEEQTKKQPYQIETPKTLINFHKRNQDNEIPTQLNSVKKDIFQSQIKKNKKTLQLRFKKQNNRFEYSFK